MKFQATIFCTILMGQFPSDVYMHLQRVKKTLIFEVAKWLQDFVMRKGQGNDGFKRQSDQSILSSLIKIDDYNCLFLFLQFNLPSDCGYTIDMSKSNQSVHSFLSLTV